MPWYEDTGPDAKWGREEVLKRMGPVIWQALPSSYIE